jgi:hypothetical protein
MTLMLASLDSMLTSHGCCQMRAQILKCARLVDTTLRWQELYNRYHAYGYTREYIVGGEGACKHGIGR